MSEPAPNSVARFARTVERCLDRGGPGAIAAAVREALAAGIAGGAFELPARASEELPDRYARRLLYRDPRGRFSVVAMAWGPGHATTLHDHDGAWCVEGVLRGTTFSVPYRLLEVRGDRCLFEAGAREAAREGDTGAIVPPFEHHVYGNASAERSARTLHVYGPELLRCACYTREEDGTWTRRERALTYDPW